MKALDGKKEPGDLETRSSLHYASKSKLDLLKAANFQRNWRTTSWSQKQCVYGPENEVAAGDL